MEHRSCLLVFLVSSNITIMLALEDSALYRNPTGDFSVGDFKRNPFHYLWVKKIISSMVEDQFDCTVLCVAEPKCYSFNMAGYPDSKSLYLCELLANDKHRETEKFHANATFHHYSPWVQYNFLHFFPLHRFLANLYLYIKKRVWIEEYRSPSNHL